MAEVLSAFVEAYNSVRKHYNEQVKDYAITSDIKDINTNGLHVFTLATMCVMLVHNARLVNGRQHYPLNIFTIANYDLWSLTQADKDMIAPYLQYINAKQLKSRTAAARGKLLADSMTLCIRYLFELQIRGIDIDVGDVNHDSEDEYR